MSKLEIASTSKIAKYRKALESLMQLLFRDNERPYFISDDATLYDIWFDSDEKVRHLIFVHYKLRLSNSDMSMPIWKLLEKISTQSSKGGK